MYEWHRTPICMVHLVLKVQQGLMNGRVNIPGQPVACNSAQLSGIFWATLGLVSCYFGVHGCQKYGPLCGS